MNLYRVLGVAEGAGEAQIKQAYRRLAKKYHPDLNPDNKEAEKRFKEIVDAYEILGQPEKRKAYDEQRKEGARKPKKAAGNDWAQKNPGPEAAFNDFMKRTGAGKAHDNPADVSAMFESFMKFKL